MKQVQLAREAQMMHQILEYVDFSSIKNINLIVDRCKNDFGIRELNDFLYTNLNLSLSLKTNFYISHEESEKHKGLQAVDMFCYGIARKYEIGDYTWYNFFKKHISVECKFKE